MKNNGQPAAFLDRDGVLNEVPLVGHVSCADEFAFIPGALGACHRLCESGYRIIVVTNQGGIARGYYSENDYRAVNQKMLDEFTSSGLPSPEVYYCPYHPIFPDKFSHFRDWRKPAPGMIYAAARQHNLCLSRSFMAGDNIWDMDAGRAAGVGKLVFISASKAKCPIDATSYTSLWNASFALPSFKTSIA